MSQVQSRVFVDRIRNGPTYKFNLHKILETCCRANMATSSIPSHRILGNTIVFKQWLNPKTEVCAKIYFVFPNWFKLGKPPCYWHSDTRVFFALCYNQIRQGCMQRKSIAALLLFCKYYCNERVLLRRIGPKWTYQRSQPLLDNVIIC